MTEKRVVSSTTASQESSGSLGNIRRTATFWNVFNVNRYILVDSDEAGIHLESCNRSMGKAFSGVSVNEIGFYSHSQKWTIIASIGADNFKNFFIHQTPGTTKEIFRDYIRSTL
jgi:hypothetical protein